MARTKVHKLKERLAQHVGRRNQQPTLECYHSRQRNGCKDTKHHYMSTGHEASKGWSLRHTPCSVPCMVSTILCPGRLAKDADMHRHTSNTTHTPCKRSWLMAERPQLTRYLPGCLSSSKPTIAAADWAADRSACSTGPARKL